MAFALDHQKHLIHLPLVAGPRTSATQLICISLAKLARPLANGLIRHDHATGKQELFTITETQTEPKVQHPAWLMIAAGNRGFLELWVAGGVSMP
jgi:hypothetical protein